MRYLLDTEILIDPFRSDPSPLLEGWILMHCERGFAISVLALTELQVGLGRLRGLEGHSNVLDWLGEVEARFENAVLPFDQSAAVYAARLMTRGCACGRPVPLADAMLCGIAEANGLIVAGRTTPHLALWGGPVVDPWVLSYV